MLIAAHSIAGGVAGDFIGNPILAFLLGIIIHFILDAIPHYDTTDNHKFTFRQWALILGDALVALLIIFLIIKPPLDINSPFLWGAIGGITPDFFDNVSLWSKQFQAFKLGNVFHNFHERIQPKQPNIFWGLLVQIVLIAIFIYLYQL